VRTRTTKYKPTVDLGNAILLYYQFNLAEDRLRFQMTCEAIGLGDQATLMWGEIPEIPVEIKVQALQVAIPTIGLNTIATILGLERGAVYAKTRKSHTPPVHREPRDFTRQEFNYRGVGEFEPIGD
jgi:hypothetical protein